MASWTHTDDEIMYDSEDCEFWSLQVSEKESIQYTDWLKNFPTTTEAGHIESQPHGPKTNASEPLTFHADAVAGSKPDACDL